MTRETQTTDEVIADVINSLCGNQKESDFLNAHVDFIEHHLDFVFGKKEGLACSHDKTKTVISLLKKNFEDGVEISINYDQEYTFHLPKTVLNNHAEIKEFYLALSFLYYGNPVKYLAMMKKLFGGNAHE